MPIQMRVTAKTTSRGRSSSKDSKDSIWVSLGSYILEQRSRAKLKTFEVVDQDSLEPEELLALLSPSQQAAFESTLSDPHQIHRLVAEELETEQPWWVEEDEDAFEGEEDLVDTLTCRPALFNEAKMPKLPVGADGKLVANPSLVNNITALL